MVEGLLSRSTGHVIVASRKPDGSNLRSLADAWPGRLSTVSVDLTSAESVHAMAAVVKATRPAGIDTLLNVAGLLHDQEISIKPERSLASVDAAAMARVISVNAIGPVMSVQALQSQLRTGGIVANVSMSPCLMLVFPRDNIPGPCCRQCSCSQVRESDRSAIIISEVGGHIACPR